MSKTFKDYLAAIKEEERNSNVLIENAKREK